MPFPTEHAGAFSLRRWGRVMRLGPLFGAYLGLLTAHCTFPEYETRAQLGEAGEAGVGASAPVGGTTSGGGQGATSSDAGEAPIAGGNGGSVGECSGEQWPVEHCEDSCLLRYADHCYDGDASGDEKDVDCGGADCQACTNEACSSGGDCLSGSCEAGETESRCDAPLLVTYTSHEQNSAVGSATWSITLMNSEPTGGTDYSIKDLKLRYYVARGGATEPLLIRATQSNLLFADGMTMGLSETHWSIERMEAREGEAYDAYVEVTFADPERLFPGDSITIYQQMLTGDPGNSLFDQRTHYSFTKATNQPWLHVTAYYQDRLAWGLEPRPINPRSCFVRAVNLNGPAVTVAGRNWQSAAQAGITSDGSGVSQGGTPYPAATGGLATMLQTATRLTAGHSFSMPVDNGSYLLYLYATSPTNDGTASVLTVQGQEPDTGGKFRAQASDGGQAWARLGAYRVDVMNGSLNVGVTTGTVSFTGLELWYPE